MYATTAYKNLHQMVFLIVFNQSDLVLRPKIWKYLLRYALINGTEDTLKKKRS
jgi:hypothetical protein